MLRGECKLCVASYTKHAAAEEEADTRQQLKIGLRKNARHHASTMVRNGTVKRAFEPDFP
jgi:hypothetical protein